MEYKIEDNHIFLKLENGEEIMNSLKLLSDKENIHCALITGIGAVNEIEIGLFDIKNKEYVKNKLEGDYELTSLQGNISLKDDNSFVHVHVNVSDEKYRVFGGHLFNAKITATGEFIITVFKNKINREYDEKTGLHLWDLNHCG